MGTRNKPSREKGFDQKNTNVTNYFNSETLGTFVRFAVQIFS